MKSRLKATLLFCIFLLTSCYERKKIFYHEYEPTASDFAIKQWDISKDNLPKYYVKETIDNQGRVIELKFFEDHSISFERLCYLSSWIKYDYPNDTTVVERNLNSKGQPEADLECEMPSKITYQISLDHKKIIKSQTEYSIDKALYFKNGWTDAQINEVLREISGSETQTSPLIGYFSKSSAKLNGKYPISNEFDIRTIFFNATEKLAIEKALK